MGDRPLPISGSSLVNKPVRMIEASMVTERTVPIIPVELYRLIFEQVTQKRDLCSVARSSTILQLEAEQILYKDISIETTIHFLSVIKSIISKPRRHRLVQILHIHGRPWDAYGRFAIYRLVARLLRMTTHLESLRVNYLPGWILHYASHPLLKHLDIKPQRRYNNDPVTQYDYPTIINYLGRHPSITNLTLDYLIEQPRINTTLFETSNLPFLPLLHTLDLRMDKAFHWLRGRQLKRFSSLSSTFGSPVEMIGIIIPLLTMGDNLVVLELSECNTEWDLIPEHVNIEKIVSSLPLLRYLGLSTPPNTSKSPQQLWEDRIVHSIRTHLKMLMVFRLRAFIGRPLTSRTIPDLLAPQESLKWILFTNQNWPESMHLLTKENYPKAERPENNQEFQKVLLNLGVQVMDESIRLVYFSAMDVRCH